MNPFYDEVRRLSDCQKIIQEKIRHLAAEKGLTNKQCGPIPDGVEDIEGYLSSSPKVMWVLKEAWGEVSEDGSVNGGGHCIYDS
ncbi:MAG: hypothetical protein K2I89_10315, partial [Muribaculaceae bacterium]|nr:hypothetical protein [Muribaculaceae bacterium]